MLDRITRFFFQKRSPETDRAAAERELRGRGSPMRGLDPDRLASAIEGFRAGSLGPLSRIVEEFELRDDTMCSCSAKMRAAAARCPHQVLIREGVGDADRERAEAHRRALDRLWARARATDALSRNAKGGIRLLLKQMMDAQSFGFSAHELVWRPTPDGALDVTFVKVPLQFFENRTGALRYLPDPNLYDGIEMAEGEWMVTAGAGVGIAAAVAACSKRLSLQDWLLFSERCGQPGLHAATDAKQGSEQWNNLVAAVANFGREWGIVTDMATKVDTVSLANGGTPPYPALVERMDRAIAVLYRGSDLSTLSAGDGSVGASQQGEEADILEQDACEMLSETLQEQVERPFIRYVFGDEEPLAYVQVSPVSHPNLEMEMKIDQHLVSLGVKLSKKEALERYQRTEASEDDPDDEPLKLAAPPAGGAGGGFGAPGGSFGLPNETPAPEMPLQRRCKEPIRGLPAPEGENARPEPTPALKRVLAAFRSDLGPAAEELQKVLALPEGEMRAACKDLAGRLPDLLPADPAMAAILAEELAGAFAEAVGEVSHEDTKARSGEALANEDREADGKFAPKGSGDQTGHGGDEHTPEEKKRIEKYEASTNQAVVDFYNRMKTADSETLDSSSIEISTSTGKMGSRIAELTGTDTTGWPIRLKGSEARHVEIRHGESGKADQSIRAEDVGRAGYVLRNFDSIELTRDQHGAQVFSEVYKNRDGTPAPIVEVRKRIDGTAVIEQAVPDSKRRTLWLASIRKEKSGSPKEN